MKREAKYRGNLEGTRETFKAAIPACTCWVAPEGSRGTFWLTAGHESLNLVADSNYKLTMNGALQGPP
jgi:hypothetical protein